MSSTKPCLNCEKTEPLAQAAGSAFWLTGWHRLIHKWDCYAYANRLSDRDRKKRGMIAKRFTLAEWRFHNSKQNDKSCDLRP